MEPQMVFIIFLILVVFPAGAGQNPCKTSLAADSKKTNEDILVSAEDAFETLRIILQGLRKNPQKWIEANRYLSRYGVHVDLTYKIEEQRAWFLTGIFQRQDALGVEHRSEADALIPRLKDEFLVHISPGPLLNYFEAKILQGRLEEFFERLGIYVVRVFRSQDISPNLEYHDYLKLEDYRFLEKQYFSGFENPDTYYLFDEARVERNILE